MQDGGITLNVPAGWSTPQTNAATAGYTTISTGGIFGRGEHSLDSPADWQDDSLIVDVGPEALQKKEGNGSVKISVYLAGSGTSHAYYSAPVSLNWSTSTHAAFWIYPGKSWNAGDIKLELSETSGVPADGTAIQYALPALNGNTWNYVVIDLSSQAPTTRDAVLTYGLLIPVTSVTTFYLDRLSLGPANPIFFGNQIETQLLQLLAQSTVTIAYGGTGSGGIGIPSGSDTVTLTTKSRIHSGGTYTDLTSGSPCIMIAVPCSSAVPTSAARRNEEQQTTTTPTPAETIINTTQNTPSVVSQTTTTGATGGTTTAPVTQEIVLPEKIRPLMTHLVKLPDDRNAKTTLDAAVYYVAKNGKRYVFPNERTYKSWYTDYTSVVVIDATTLSEMPIGGIVHYRPWSRMLKMPSNPLVYVVERYGVLRPILSESVAQALYGLQWGTFVDDLPEPFFTQYKEGLWFKELTYGDLAGRYASITTIEENLFP